MKKKQTFNDVFAPVPPGHMQANGHLIDMSSHAATLNSLVARDGPPPAEHIPTLESMFGVKWDGNAKKFV